MTAAMLLLLLSPLVGGAVLALVGHRRYAAEVNVTFCLLTFGASAGLVARVIAQGPVTALGEEFFVDSLNVFLVALTAFVAMTTSLFSRPYMRIERSHGRVSDAGMRLYHSMYQLFTFPMLLVLTTNNLGVMWVAMEAATLTTVLLVALYRTHASLEAAWKYFILCGVGIAQALWVLEVERLGPFLVEGDAAGRSLFALANREINLRIAEVYKTLPPPALSRFGEVLSRTDEVV